MTTSMFLQMLLNGLQLSFIYILLALGFTLIFGILHIINLAHGCIYMLGGYIIWLTFTMLKLNYFLSLVITIVIVGLIGLGMERILFRRLQGKVMPTIIVSLGLMLVLEQSATVGFGGDSKIVPNPFPGLLHFWGTAFPVQRLVIMLIAMILTGTLVLWVQKSKAGLALRAVALDSETASLHGISYPRYGALTFGLGFGLAGIAGALVAPLYYVDPYIGGHPLMKMFTICIVGGLGSVPGAIIAAFLLGFIDSFVATLIDSVVAAMVGFGMIIVVLLVKPTGLFGHE